MLGCATHSRIKFALCSFLIAVIVACSNGQAPSADNVAKSTKTVAVTQIVEHPALNLIRDGLKEELATQGFEESKNLKWQWASAQGNQSTAVQIAQKFAGETPDVLVAISTPSAQAVLSSALKDAPNTAIVFSGVTDPVSSKLVSNLQHPGSSITGVSNLTPVADHLKLIAQITPKAKRVGVIYNSGEANAVYVVKLLKEAASKQGLSIVEVTITNSSEVSNAAKSLIGRADAIYVPTDNTVVSAIDSVIKVGIENKLPVYATDNNAVEAGAIAALGFDYREMGRQTGRMVVRVLKGEKPGTIAVESPGKVDLVINAKSAASMGVKIPANLLNTANKVIQ
jgi:putative tryptophan/tyrosine transport system substrate-binding protein